ncbi:uncharacterized protein LOC124683643 [Lolium rigidum]|uniref:uncharacterized protein LOC124683643 n=1 Tax=Lolium rigidum TaxID=89674 RepID=UPI001F5C52F6|nr:uncharacterized protein LOC124683643 [Lolium rigidum]
MVWLCRKRLVFTNNQGVVVKGVKCTLPWLRHARNSHRSPPVAAQESTSAGSISCTHPLPWLEPPLGVAMRHRGVHPTPTPSSLVCAARSQHEALGALSLHQRGLLLFQGDGDMMGYSFQVVRRPVQVSQT